MRKTQGFEEETTVVPRLDPEVVAHIRLLLQLGWGTKRIAQEVGVARNSVRSWQLVVASAGGWSWLRGRGYQSQLVVATGAWL